MTSQCCDAALASQRTSSVMRLDRCIACGSLWCTHSGTPSNALPWQDLLLTARFAAALKHRRRIQAEQICDSFPELAAGTVLDYGTGQATFPSVLLERGLDAWGCDLDLGAPGRAALADRVIQLPGPWAIPDGRWGAISMLDVIEHHAAPLDFLRQLPADRLLLKVPLATGPLTQVARLADRLGRPGLLDAIALVGDASPHQVLFTRQGLTTLADRAGWRLVRAKAIADVGSEMPDRMRIEGVLANRMVRPVVAAGGAATELLARVWSDTVVALFARARPSAF